VGPRHHEHAVVGQLLGHRAEDVTRLLLARTRSEVLHVHTQGVEADLARLQDVILLVGGDERHRADDQWVVLQSHAGSLSLCVVVQLILSPAGGDALKLRADVPIHLQRDISDIRDGPFSTKRQTRGNPGTQSYGPTGVPLPWPPSRRTGRVS